MTAGRVVGLALLALAGSLVAQRVPDTLIDHGRGPALSQRPQIIVDGASVYVLWHDGRSGQGDVYFNRSLDGGTTWLPAEVRLDSGPVYASGPQMAVSGDVVYALWHQDSAVYLNRSLDRGATWLADAVQIPVLEAVDDIAVSGDTLYVAWMTSGDDEILFNRSLDRGTTWLPQNVELDDNGDTAFHGPELAVSGDAVYVTWQDERLGNWHIYFNRSLDRGTTWLPSDMRIDLAPDQNRSDEPRIAASGDAVYITWQDGRNGSYQDPYFNRSLDRGTTWLLADVRLNSGALPGSGGSPPEIAVSGDVVYTVWSDSRRPGTTADIYLNRSMDRGATWLSSDVRLDRGPDADLGVSRFPQIAASSTAVYVTWEDSRTYGFGDDWDIHVNSSLDLGTTWLAQDLRIDSGPGPYYRYDSMAPQVAAAGPIVYVAWTDFRKGYPDIYGNRSTDGGVTWLSEEVRFDTDEGAAPASSFSPRIAASSDNVYVAWRDRRNASSDLYLNRSLDGGGTWVSEQQVNEERAVSAHDLEIAASGESVYAIWLDFRNGKDDVFFNRSPDRGATWLPDDVRIDLRPGTSIRGSAGSRAPQIAASGDFVYVVWDSFWNESGWIPMGDYGDIYFDRSADRGATWLPGDLRVDTASGMARNPRIAASGETVYATWELLYTDWDIRFSRSRDGGLTWLSEDVRVDRAPDGASSQSPRMAAIGDAVYVVWEDRRQDGGDIYFSESGDGGSTWLASDVRLDHGASVSTDPQISASGGNVYVAWQDDRDGETDIYFNRMSGGSWLPSDLRLDTASAPGTATSYAPQIAARDGTVCVVWEDGPDGSEDIHLNLSVDGGLHWLPVPVRLDTGSAPGAARSVSPRIAFQDDRVYVVWQDDRSGSADIYFNIPLGSLPYGEGKAGSGGVVPQLRVTGLPTLGNTVSLQVSGGLGGATAILGIGFGPGSKVSIPFYGGTLLVDPVSAWIQRALGGVVDVPGAGDVSFGIQIPVDVSLLGLDFNTQAGILDPNVPFGISLTNGVETWIL